MDFYTPSRANHGSYFFDWTTRRRDRLAQLLPGLVPAAERLQEDGRPRHRERRRGFIYNTWGFGYIHEMELLQEAGFHPLEVIRAATMHGAEALHEPKGQPPEFGIVRAGMLADMVLVDQNPLQNLKVLYGTGAVKLNDETGRRSSASAASATPSRTASSTTRRSCSPTSPAMVEKQKKRQTNGDRVDRSCQTSHAMRYCLRHAASFCR
jgi:hypothetical protein